jgi:transcriptional regulator with XRE-family HTH domain
MRNIVSDFLLTAFGERLRILRLKKGFSQEKLAELAGLHRTYVGGVERGERNPTLATLNNLARALDISIAELVDFSCARLDTEIRVDDCDDIVPPTR